MTTEKIIWHTYLDNLFSVFTNNVTADDCLLSQVNEIYPVHWRGIPTSCNEISDDITMENKNCDNWKERHHFVNQNKTFSSASSAGPDFSGSSIMAGQGNVWIERSNV